MSGFFSLKTKILASAALVCLCTAGAQAQDVLTRERIDIFYEQAAQVQMRGVDEVLAFYDKHTAPEAHMAMTVTTNIKGAPPQKSSVVYDKAKILEETRKGYEAGKIKSVENKVISAEIAPDGRSAKVKSSSFGVFTLSVPSSQGEITLKNEQAMFCDDMLSLADDGVLRSTDSTCSVEVTSEPVAAE